MSSPVHVHCTLPDVVEGVKRMRPPRAMSSFRFTTTSPCGVMFAPPEYFDPIGTFPVVHARFSATARSTFAPYMPQGMQDIGTAMHHAASQFAVEAQNASVSNDVRPALAALGTVMQQCVACHAAYRLQ
jgi:hypothetical protein